MPTRKLLKNVISDLKKLLEVVFKKRRREFWLISGVRFAIPTTETQKNKQFPNLSTERKQPTHKICQIVAFPLI